MRKNVASQVVSFQGIATADGAPITTGTPVVYYTVDGGTQGTGAGTSTHEGQGQWSYVPAQAETNGNHVAFTFVLTGAINQTVNVWPVSFDPTAADLGAPAVTLAATATSAQLVDDIYDEPQADHIANGSIGRSIQLAGAILVDTTITGTPTATIIELTAGSTQDNYYLNQKVYVTDGAGGGQSKICINYVGATKVLTVDEAYVVTPSSGNRVVVQSDHQHTEDEIASAVRTEMDSNSTQFAALISACTEARLAELDAANLPTNIDTLLVRIIGTLSSGVHNPASAAQIAVLSDWINGGRLDVILDFINASTSGLGGAAMRGTDGANTTVPDNSGITGIQTDLDNSIDGLGALKALIDDIKGATFNTSTDSLEAIRNRGDSAWPTATGFATETKQDAQDLIITESRLSELDAANIPTDLATLLVRIIGTLSSGVHNPASAAQIAVLTDWIDGGRLDLLLDLIESKTNQLTFSKTNELDTNGKSINNGTIIGDGKTTPFDIV